MKITKENPLPLMALLALIGIVGVIINFDNDESKTAPIKIGFILTGGKYDEGWNGQHYAAMQKVCDKLGAKLLVKEHIVENTGACTDAIRCLAEDGVNMIFLTSYAYPAEAIRVVGEYPQIAFAGITAEHTAKNLTAYFTRLYQARYLSGIIAGMRTRSNTIGYVAAMPNAEVNRGINAFALGAQSVNPTVEVVVAWTNSWQDGSKEELNARRLVQETGADVLTYHQNQKYVAEAAEKLGVDFIGYHEALTGYSNHNLTSVVCHWEAYYHDIVKRYLKGVLNAKKINWLGIEQNTVYLSPYSERVTEEMRKRVEYAKQNMLDGHFIFAGELYDNEGNLRCAADEAMSDDILLKKMDWLVKGVRTLD